jgi:hypothetical protein
MMRSRNPRIPAALTAITLGILFWRLPEQWIELQFGTSLDGGSGLAEFLLVFLPISLGVELLLISTPAVARVKDLLSKRQRTRTA